MDVEANCERLRYTRYPGTVTFINASCWAAGLRRGTATRPGPLLWAKTSNTISDLETGAGLLQMDRL